MNHEAKIIKFRYLMSCMLSQGPTFMKFNRSRKFYILCSFGVVLTIFFYSHWKTFKILDQNNKRIALVDQESSLANGEHERDEERRDEKCRLGNDVQTSAHCVDNAVLGVAPSDKLSYQPNTLDHFVCLDGELSITWKSVNDDYCDCKDGSDEPGTSACPNMRFYCAGKQQYLPSSRVNDGICDCCDGSDEWKKQTVRADVLKKHNFNIKYAPCGNFC